MEHATSGVALPRPRTAACRTSPPRCTAPLPRPQTPTVKVVPTDFLIDSGTLFLDLPSFTARDNEVAGTNVSERTLRAISQAFPNKIEHRCFRPIIEHPVAEDDKPYDKDSIPGYIQGDIFSNAANVINHGRFIEGRNAKEYFEEVGTSSET